MTRTESRQRIQRGNGQTAGYRGPGRLREGVKKGEREERERRGGPEPPSDGKDSKLKIRDRV